MKTTDMKSPAEKMTVMERARAYKCLANSMGHNSKVELALFLALVHPEIKPAERQRIVFAAFS